MSDGFIEQRGGIIIGRIARGEEVVRVCVDNLTTGQATEIMAVTLRALNDWHSRATAPDQ